MSTTFEAHLFVNDGASDAFAEILGGNSDGLAKISIPRREFTSNFFAPLNNSEKTEQATPGLAKPRKMTFEILYKRTLLDRLALLEGVSKSWRVEEPATTENVATRMAFDGHIETIDDDLEKGKQRFIKVSVQMKGNITITTPA